jgi:prolyl-tRNA synthetase
MAVPVVKGVKTENERFAGADETFCIEGLMQDGKALQMGTSHFLGQNFAKAFDVKFVSKENVKDYVWATSWGVSTRLMGALIMSHSDDDGLVLPPKLAPIQVVIVPITGKKEDEKALVLEKAREYFSALKAKGILVKLDDRDGISPGYKFADYELKGVPLRIAIGSRDVAAGNVELAKRDTKTKEIISAENLPETISNLLDEIQNSIYNKALEYRNSHIHTVNNWDEFMDAIENKTGFVSAHWDGTGETEEKIKDLSKATIRCVPLNNVQEDGVCVLTGKPSTQRVLFAKAY